ncbi:MAG TPA: sulfotransferase [Solirubrobacteraceae bacterium]|nr:sulfotransferase [Solirubrobacteraceae bacterium]
MSAEPNLDTRAGPEQTRVPDFFIVGHAKCGTTALYEMLRRHPQIFMPALKEPLYFATDLRARFQRRAAGPLPTALEDYLALFADAGAEQRAGEASSSYLWSRDAAGHIAKLQPNARIIAVLREPASFLRSLHLQLLQNHIESQKDLRKALALEPARRQGRRIPRRSNRPQALLYSERVRYVDQLRRYHALFPSEQMLVLIYDDFRSENEATVRRVLRFLDVDDTIPIHAVEANPTVRVRSQQLDELVNAVSVGRGPLSRAVKASLKTLIPDRVRGGALELTLQHVVYGGVKPAEEDVMLDIRRRFRGEVEALSEYLGRDLVGLWGYDELG